MLNFLHAKNIYADVGQLCTLIDSLEFDTVGNGEQILNFNHIPPDLKHFFENVLHHPIEIQPDSGIFRKPNHTITVEPFYQHTLWIAVVALESTTITLHSHNSGKTIFDMTEMDNDVTNWTTTHQIKLEPNEFVLFRPWNFYSLSEAKLVQIFNLNAQLEKIEE